MGTYRVHKTKDYTVMSNYHLRDKTLSLKTKGLLSLMLSLPDDWHYSVSGLATLSKDGVDAVKAALRELEANGYLVRSQKRANDGRMGENIYDIYETPQSKSVLENFSNNGSNLIGAAESGENTPFSPQADFPPTVNGKEKSVEEPQVDFPLTVKPPTDKPLTENQPLLITNNINYLNTKESKKESAGRGSKGEKVYPRKSYDEIVDEMISDGEVREQMREFIRARTRSGKYLTNNQLIAIIKRLHSFTADAGLQKQIIATSVRNGWNDLYNPKEKQYGANSFHHNNEREYDWQELEKLISNRVETAKEG